MATQSEGGGKDEIKTQFMTREGIHKLMTLSEYSRPTRVAFNGQGKDQVSLKAQCWYIPEMCNSRIPEMRNSRCTRIIEMHNSGIPAMCNSCIAGLTIGAILIIP